jgi:hypothetical protein
MLSVRHARQLALIPIGRFVQFERPVWIIKESLIAKELELDET